MKETANRDAEVLIVGAGPTGLSLGLWLTRLGIRIRIIDKAKEPGTTSRALALQARTLEFYRQIGIADTVVARGLKAEAINFHAARASGMQTARAAFGEAGDKISPFPYVLVFPQDEHERLLTDRLAAVGVGIERQTELVGFREAMGRVTARLKRPDGIEEICEAAAIAGCDGARSAVREMSGIGFPGGEYEHLFYVADVEASGPVTGCEVHIAVGEADFLAVFPLNGDARVRLVGAVRGGEHSEILTWDDVDKDPLGWMNINVRAVNWFSTYRVHHRVADRFRQGCSFLLGDAAHIHSPVGGQGMNTGIGDAVNLAWKLAAVLRGRANASLLDTYEPERIAFARRLVATTDRAFTAVSSSGAIPASLRLSVLPALIPSLFAASAARRFIFRRVSQTAINYRGSGLSEGRAGTIRGGDRLPWVPPAPGNEDNFQPLTSLDWQVHLYGDAAPDLGMMCDREGLALHIFPWRPEAERAGLRRGAVYLVRPDGYVALADPGGDASALTAYLNARGIRRMAGTSQIEPALHS